MRRRILARGSHDDMTALEVSLLKNRKRDVGTDTIMPNSLYSHHLVGEDKAIY